MKRHKHSKGPWHADLDSHKWGPLIIEIGNSGKPLAFVYDSPTKVADAHLLSTAPDGLALAKFVVKKFNQGQNPDSYIDDDTYDLVILAKALIARARGKYD